MTICFFKEISKIYVISLNILEIDDVNCASKAHRLFFQKAIRCEERAGYTFCSLYNFGAYELMAKNRESPSAIAAPLNAAAASSDGDGPNCNRSGGAGQSREY
jgi:hypothetical protein